MIKIINDPVILIDGSFYVHRVYYAFPPLTTSTGIPVWVVYGVINMIKSLLIRYQPIHIVVVFDKSGRTFRDDLFKEYKANRINMPKDLYNQIYLVYEIIEAMGIPILSVPYVEADDVIATLAVFYERLGKTVLVSTGDKDIAQIVSDRIMLINAISNVIFDVREVERFFGVPPVLIADYLALIGDRVDNIPGIPGIGKKTAKILLTKIGNIKTLYENLDNISILGIRNFKMIRDSLLLHKEIAWLSYKLATVKVDVPLNQSDYVLSVPKINFKNLLMLFKKYEFNSWLTELKLGTWLNKYKYFNSISLNPLLKNNTCIHQLEAASQNCLKSEKIIDYTMYSIDMLYKWIKEIKINDFIIFYIYVDTLDVVTANIMSVCLSKCTVYKSYNLYIPIDTTVLNDHNKYFFNLQEVLLILKPILENSKIKKIGQNLKFYCSLLKRYNINLSGIAFDVVLEWYVLYGTANYQSIKNFLDSTMFDAVSNFEKNHASYINSYVVSNIKNTQLESFWAVNLLYSIFDLHQILWSKIQKDSQLKRIFEDVELPLMSILCCIESYGVLIDKNLLSAYEIELNSRLDELKIEVYRLANLTFNINSNKQLQEVLYNQQKLPVLKKTPNGSPSTSEEVLKKLARQYYIPKIILKYRVLYKLKSTYTNKLISMINAESNRIHTSYNQTRTATGRLSSANPNLQNIPNRNHDGRKIRRAFVAPSNFLIVSADYSQIELRIMAHLSHDYKLISDFVSGKDIHAITAAEIFVTALHLVTHEQRHLAKTINFGLMYGMSAFGLSRQLSVTCKKAQEYVDRYFQRYPGIMQYIQDIKNKANKNGYVSTLDGRKLYLPAIYSTNISQKKSAERAAINAPMQGSAADIIKKAMISIDCWLKADDVPVHMIMQVHDELVFEVQNNFVDFAIKKIKKLMEECYTLDVPLKVDIGVGKNWEQAH